MKLIKADHDRRIAIPGVPDLVPRPVDIDASQTGFANLRTLRIYQFEAGSTIEGHAEEDEVLVIVLAGSIELTFSDDNSGKEPRPVVLSAPNASHDDPCAAYLPPQSAYRLVAKTQADVAYARATPASGPPSTVFTPRSEVDPAGVTVWLEEMTYPQRLRLRVVQINAPEEDIEFGLLDGSDAGNDALVHFRTVPAAGAARITSDAGDAIKVDSWDTLAVAPGDRAIACIAKSSSALILVVWAI